MFTSTFLGLFSRSKEMVRIKLLEEEQNWFQLNVFQPITTVSFYEINETSTGASNAEDYLTERFTDILKMNAWLCGRLVKETMDGKKNIFLSFSEEICNPRDYVLTITDDKLFERKEWRSIWKYITQYVTKKGSECVDKNEMLCKLIIVQNSALTELALVFSLNHTIGDGYTFYYLWKMLDKNQDINSMTVEREHNFGDYVKRDTNLPYAGYNTSKAVKDLFGLLGRGIVRKVCRKSEPIVDMYRVNAEAINSRKKQYNKGDTFVSTNDILNSWFFGKETCEIENMTMAVNMRGKLPEIKEDMAGNYHLFCPVSLTGVENPIAFRDKWTKLVNKEQQLGAVAGLIASTNWATFFHEVELNSYTHTVHIPVYDPRYFPACAAGVPFCQECCMIIFRVNREDLGLFLVLYNDLPRYYFDNCEMLSGKVFS